MRSVGVSNHCALSRSILKALWVRYTSPVGLLSQRIAKLTLLLMQASHAEMPKDEVLKDQVRELERWALQLKALHK
eukprot:2314764-Amphidinium_carterae.2